MNSVSVKSKTKEELIDITGEVNRIIRAKNMDSGICLVYTPHTTAAITINENADPDVPRDLLKGLLHLRLENVSFDHREGNSPAHLKSTLVGCSEMIIIDKGELILGTWQGIFFCEFDGPRTRKVHIKII